MKLKVGNLHLRPKVVFMKFKLFFFKKVELLACSQLNIVMLHISRLTQQAESSWDVKNILDGMNLKCGMYAIKTADKAIDVIQGDLYERYNFYMDSCAISPSGFLLFTVPKKF